MVAGIDLALLARGGAVGEVFLAAAEAPLFTALMTILEDHDVGPEPLSVEFDWPGLDGVDGAVVDPLTMTIAPPSSSAATIPLGALPSRLENGELIVDVPGERRIRSLHLADLATDEEEPVLLRGEGDLGSRRLSISAAPPGGGFGSPVAAVPAVGWRGQIPPTLTGATYDGNVLTIPDVAGRQLRISLVDGATPEEFARFPVTAGEVTAWAAPTPRDLTVTGPDGSTLWAYPGELALGSPIATADLTAGVQGALTAMFTAGGPLNGAITVTAKYTSRAALSLPQVRGALVRHVPGITSAELAGSPAPVAVTGVPLPVATPTAAIADVIIRYAGLRLAELSDLLPASGAVEGLVVTDQPALRPLPPQALHGQQVARIGVVGRALAGSGDDQVDLTVGIVDAASGGPLGDPAVLSLVAGGAIDVVWATLRAPVTVDRPVAISVTATRGTFAWVADPQPLVRVAIVDPDPGGRLVLLAGETLVTLPAPELTVNRATLPAHPFAGGGSELVFASALFCTIELADIELRYARGGGGS